MFLTYKASEHYLLPYTSVVYLVSYELFIETMLVLHYRASLSEVAISDINGYQCTPARHLVPP